MNDKVIPVFDSRQVGKILKWRVCARCYGDLKMSDAPEGKYFALCVRCGSAWHGAHVSRKYAERLGQRALTELYEVKINLADLWQEIKPLWITEFDKKFSAMSETEKVAALMGF